MSAGRFAARSPFLRGRSSGLEADLLNRLRKLPVGASPDLRFKADLRSQLVAITARVVAESATTFEGVPARAAQAGAASRRRFRAIAAHRGISFAGLVAALALIIVSATAMSHGALPGDTLYKLKRASENMELSLASGDLAKGREYLDQASTRVKEVRELLAKSPSAHNQALASHTLADADSASRNGTQALGRAAVNDVTSQPLDELSAWARTQRSALVDIKGASSGATATRATQSLALLDRIAKRASDLRANIGCPCLSSANSDELGPAPCHPCKPLTPQTPGLGTKSPNSSGPGSLHPSATGPGTAANVPTQTGSVSGLTTGAKLPNPQVSGPSGITVPLPHLPVSLPALTLAPIPGVSVAVNGDGVSVSSSAVSQLGLSDLLRLTN